MPYKSNNTNHQSRENHGKPGDEGQAKGAGNKPIGRELDEPRITDEYTEDGADKVGTPIARHPNRHPDKPDLDKPPYGGSH